MPIETWFPLAVYYEDLADAVRHREGMIAAVLDLERSAASEPENQNAAAWTGDVHKVSQIHRDPRFAWIVAQLEHYTARYLTALGIDFAKVDLYIQRSWPVISRGGQWVGAHKHHNANISAVYYVAVPNEGDSGGLTFYNESRMNEISQGLSTNQTRGYLKSNVLNFESVSYAAREGRLILFPAKQQHGVASNQTESPRISLAFDIAIAASEDGSYEFLPPPPKTWTRIKKPDGGS